jgi:hypothetical protein
MAEKEKAKNSDTPERRPLEEWAAEHNTPEWLLAAAKVKNGWAIGQELTETEFKKGVDSASKERIG